MCEKDKLNADFGFLQFSLLGQGARMECGRTDGQREIREWVLWKEGTIINGRGNATAANCSAVTERKQFC